MEKVTQYMLNGHCGPYNLQLVLKDFSFLQKACINFSDPKKTRKTEDVQTFDIRLTSGQLEVRNICLLNV